MNPTDSTATVDANASLIERRGQKDRRKHSWRTITYCGLHGRGRRKHARRKGQNYYLDQYQPRLVFTGIGVLLLSCLDALLTLTLLNHGAYEANRFMAHMLEFGTATFVATKITITCVGILFLLMHAHFRILRITSGRQVLKLLLSVYGLLVAYEIVLLGIIR